MITPPFPQGQRTALTVAELERMWRLTDDPTRPPQRARISVGRSSGHDLRNGRIWVSIDDQTLGRLAYGELLNQPIDPGPHTVCVSNGWLARTLIVHAAAGEDLVVQCGTGRVGAHRCWDVFRPLLAVNVWVARG